MTLQDSLLEKIFNATDRSVRLAASAIRRAARPGGILAPSSGRGPGRTFRMPLGVFSVSFIIFCTFTTLQHDSTTAAVTGAEAQGPEAPATAIATPPEMLSNVPVEAAADLGAETTTGIAPLSPTGPASVETQATEEPAGPARAAWTPRNITRGYTDLMETSITFDGGINGDEAERILDILRAKGVKTTMFLTGVFIQRVPELTRRMAADGHEIGNHLMTHPHLTSYASTYTHNTLPYVTREYIARQLRETEELYHEVTGAEMAPVWRAPYGEINDRIRRWAFEAGYVHVGWTSDYVRRESLDSLDWVSDRSNRLYLSSAEIRDKVLGFGRNNYGARGGIILMHLGTRRSADKAVETLDELLDGLEARGYSLVKVSTMISRMRDGRRALELAKARRKGTATAELARLDGSPHPRPSL